MATARDVVLIGVLLFALGTGLFVVHYTSRTMFTEMLSIGAVNQTESAVTIFSSMNSTIDRFDWFMFVFFMGLMISLVVSSWFVPGHPVYAAVYMVVVVVGVVAAAVMSNAWEAVSQSSHFVSTLSSFPITNHLLSYLPYYVAGAGMIGLVVMFAKPRDEGDTY